MLKMVSNNAYLPIFVFLYRFWRKTDGSESVRNKDKFSRWLLEYNNVLNQVSHDHRSFERNLSNCEQKPEKVRTSTGFKPVTSRYRCDALTKNCDDHGLLDFKSAVQYMKHFIYITSTMYFFRGNWRTKRIHASTNDKTKWDKAYKNIVRVLL